MQSSVTEFLKPRVVKVHPVAPRQARIVIEPFERGFGHTLGKSIGMGFVRNPDGVTADYVLQGRYELDVATQRVPCEVTLKPLYDPENLRIKA